MSRIERALARIEAAAQTDKSTDLDTGLRHEALRTRVAAALADLDGLISDLER